MSKTYRVNVFGKAGCAKCKVLNQRLDDILTRPEWSAFEKRYVDVDTEEGLVALCMAECINPQRIPAMVVEQRTEEASFAYVANPAPGAHDEVLKSTALYSLLGLQTDYSEKGKGVITPKQVQHVLEKALEA